MFYIYVTSNLSTFIENVYYKVFHNVYAMFELWFYFCFTFIIFILKIKDFLKGTKVIYSTLVGFKIIKIIYVKLHRVFQSIPDIQIQLI